MEKEWKKGLTKEQLMKVADLEYLVSTNSQTQEVKDMSGSQRKSVKKNIVMLMNESSSTSTDPDFSPPAMSQSSPTSPSSIPISQFSQHSDTSLNSDTHNSRFCASLAEFLTENENKDISANLMHRVSVAANTPIRYEKSQLLQLILEHLVLSGFYKTAEMLKNESRIVLVPLTDSSGRTDPPVIQVVDTKHKVSLGSIVSDYLVSQHALCRSPMTTIPKFDLLNPHKCPGLRYSRAAPNFTVRHSKKDLLPPCGGPDGLKLDRKLIYSRFKPVKSLAADPGTEFFSSCAFSGDNKFL